MNPATNDADSQQRGDSTAEGAMPNKSEDLAARHSQAAQKKRGIIVENDPESEARVIESWIRDAGSAIPDIRFCIPLQEIGFRGCLSYIELMQLPLL